MKQRIKFILIAAIPIIAIAIYYIWFLNSSPYLDASKISSIEQYRLPSPPKIITISDKATIQQFVEYFNSLNFEPKKLFLFPHGGWYARDVIKFENSNLVYDIAYEKREENYVWINFKGRYYKLSLKSCNNLLDIISNTIINK
jgi:hypothetical protein